MNILEALKDHDDGMKVKIGSEDGDSFWYVGKVKDVKDGADIINAAMRQHAYTALKKAEKNLREYLYSFPTPRSYAKRELEKQDPMPTPKGYEEALQEYFVWAVKKQETVRRRQADYNGFKGLLEREVISCEECDPVADDNCILVIIEGRERGAVWTTDEVKELPKFTFFGG